MSTAADFTMETGGCSRAVPPHFNPKPCAARGATIYGERNYRCCAPGCHNNRRSQPDILFHKFPSDEFRCNLWLDAIHKPSLKDLTPKQVQSCLVICSDHFLKSAYKTKKHLKNDAIPTFFKTRTITNEKIQLPPRALVQNSPNKIAMKPPNFQQ